MKLDFIYKCIQFNQTHKFNSVKFFISIVRKLFNFLRYFQKHKVIGVSRQLFNYRSSYSSSYSQLFCQTDVSKNFTKLQFATLFKKRLCHRCFIQMRSFTEYFCVTASVFIIVLVSLLLTLIRFHTLFQCFHC